MNPTPPVLRSERFVVIDLVPNPPSEVGAFNPSDADACLQRQLQFNDERNRRFLGAHWMNPGSKNPGRD